MCLRWSDPNTVGRRVSLIRKFELLLVASASNNVLKMLHMPVRRLGFRFCLKEDTFSAYLWSRIIWSLRRHRYRHSHNHPQNSGL